MKHSGFPFIMSDNYFRTRLAEEYAKPERERDLGLMRELSSSLFSTNQPSQTSAGTKTARQPEEPSADTKAEHQPKEMSDHTKWLVRVALEGKTAHNVQLAMAAVNKECDPDLVVLRELWRISGI